MKPRSAVAAFILSALASPDRSALYAHVQRGYKQKSTKPLTANQKARVDAIYDFYVDQIRTTLATTPFEGDTAEVAGFEPPTAVDSVVGVNSAANEQTVGDPTDDIVNDIQLSGPIVLASLLGGLGSRPSRDLPGLTINVSIGDVRIGNDALAA
jgi:hypothetical protein